MARNKAADGLLAKDQEPVQVLDEISVTDLQPDGSVPVELESFGQERGREAVMKDVGDSTVASGA